MCKKPMTTPCRSTARWQQNTRSPLLRTLGGVMCVISSCRLTQAPTRLPSEAPTALPTQAPSIAPTALPTTSPTAVGLAIHYHDQQTRSLLCSAECLHGFHCPAVPDTSAQCGSDTGAFPAADGAADRRPDTGKRYDRLLEPSSFDSLMMGCWAGSYLCTSPPKCRAAQCTRPHDSTHEPAVSIGRPRRSIRRRARHLHPSCTRSSSLGPPPAQASMADKRRRSACLEGHGKKQTACLIFYVDDDSLVRA